MKKMKLKPFVVPAIYAMSIIAIVGSVALIQGALSKSKFKDDEFEYVIDENSLDIPVVTEEEIIVRPYTDNTITISKFYYDYQAEKNKQEDSIVFYEDTYIQNSGVDYTAKSDNFDVVSVLKGTVIRSNEDPLLGKSVDIRHENNMISSYQCLSEVYVEKDSEIEQGFLIGKSGTCSISNELKDHLHFEMFYNGKVINPEEVFDKKVSEL